MENNNKSFASKFHLKFILFFLIATPFLIRLYFYNTIKDLPLGWIIWSGTLILALLFFGKSTRNNSHEVKIFGNSTHIRTKFLFPLLLPLLLTSFMDDAKLTEQALYKNFFNYTHYNYLKGESGERLKDKEESMSIFFNVFTVITRVGNVMSSYIQEPILNLFPENKLIKNYRQCLQKKLDDKFPEGPKKTQYQVFMDDYIKENGYAVKMKNFKQFEANLDTLFYETYFYRLKRTWDDIVSKVIKMEPIGGCS